ncbi:hypothetical protein [Nonomuraea sp. SBT364]|uniref:hypothetical protein n=1 Tax=Nonomuraea sp. SBT364 TaxID=1580530 RepID=UPI00066DBE13|nr:hypothetical protein [Nonomuraea sp. SBT364]
MVTTADRDAVRDLLRRRAQLVEAAAGALDRARPVVVYRHDWLSAALPYEGEARLVARQVRPDPVVTGLDEPLDELGDRVLADPGRASRSNRWSNESDQG